MPTKFLIVGSGGRESAFAERLSKDTCLFAVMPHKNQTIIDCIKRSGGRYLIGDPADPDTVTDFAREMSIDYAFVNSDEPLANGVVDMLVKNGFRAVGGTKDAARIEWDKIYSIEMMKRLCPEFTPRFVVVTKKDQIEQAVSWFKSEKLEMAVKPQGLTGGKGVKVMPDHLPTYKDCTRYIAELLEKNPHRGVLLVEKLYGIEFTIMGITDGKTLVMSPASYDYPFRYEDDCGPGTGGMGCFTGTAKKLPFMTDEDFNNCENIMQRIIDDMRSRGLLFKGVINGGFFKTSHGIKFMEFNSRFGDPEALNIMNVLDGSFSKIIVSLWDGTLSKDIAFAKKASVVKYLVAPEYPSASKDSTVFKVDRQALKQMGVKMYLASCIKKEERYETLKKSRAVAFVAVSDTIENASLLVDEAIDSHVEAPGLEYRRDIGSKTNLEKLQRIAAGLDCQ